MILVAEKDSQILEMVKSDIRSSLACLQSTELRMLNEHTSHLFFFLKFSLTSHLLGQEVLKVYKNAQPRTSSRMSVLSKPHFRNRSGYELSKLSMHFFKLEPEILICLPLVPKLIKNQSANIWKLFEFFDFVM